MKIEDRFRVEIEMEQSMSPVSKKSSSEYYELLVQVRLLYFDDIDVVKEVIFNRMTDTFNSINKVEERDNGFDFYFRTHGIMSKVPSLFVKDYLINEKRSKKLVGRDNLVSKDKYRYTQSITLVNLKKGNKIRYKGDDYSIKAINKNDLVLLEETTGKKKVLTYSIVKDYLEVLNK